MIGYVRLPQACVLLVAFIAAVPVLVGCGDSPSGSADAEALDMMSRLYDAERAALTRMTSIPYPRLTPGKVWLGMGERSSDSWADVCKASFVVGVTAGLMPPDSPTAELDEALLEDTLEAARQDFGPQRGAELADYVAMGRTCGQTLGVKTFFGLADDFTPTKEAVQGLPDGLSRFYSKATHRKVLPSDAALVALMRASGVNSATVDALETEIASDPEEWWRSRVSGERME